MSIRRKNTGIEILAPNQTKHTEAMFDLIAKTFPGGYYYWLDSCRNGYVNHSSYDWSASRIAIAAGEIVAHVGIWQYNMRLGMARLKTGGVGIVCTHQKHRGKGLGQRIFAAALEAMSQLDYDFSLLFGIPNYYTQFGYVPLWPKYKIEIAVDALPENSPTLKRRVAPINPLLRGEGPLAAIHNREYARQVGSAERPIYKQEWRPLKLHELIDRRERPVGYIVSQVEGKTLHVSETGGHATPAGRGQLLRHLRSLAKAACCETIRLNIPPDHPLMPPLRRLGCQATVSYLPAGGAMGRPINLPAMIQKMIPELTLRLRDSVMATFRGSLAIDLLDQRVVLSIRDGGIALGKPTKSPNALSGSLDITRLLLGSDQPQAVIETGAIRCTGKAEQLAEALFPVRNPHLSALDVF